MSCVSPFCPSFYSSFTVFSPEAVRYSLWYRPVPAESGIFSHPTGIPQRFARTSGQPSSPPQSPHSNLPPQTVPLKHEVLPPEARSRQSPPEPVRRNPGDFNALYIDRCPWTAGMPPEARGIPVRRRGISCWLTAPDITPHLFTGEVILPP